MLAYVISLFISCIALCFLPMSDDLHYATDHLDIVAANFVRYQGASTQYFSENPSTVGVIPQSAMDLMPGYHAIEAWQNQVSGGLLYNYFPDGQRLIPEVLKKMKNSKRVGLNQSGNLVSPLYGDLGVALPAFIPEGSLVTVSK